MMLSLALAGCASRPKLDPNTDWNSRIGSYTYDQAVAELGKPDAISESNEGKTADWIRNAAPRFPSGSAWARESMGPTPPLGWAWALPFRRRRTENTCA